MMVLELIPKGCHVIVGDKASGKLNQAVGGQAVAIPGSDATSNHALDGAAVERFEDVKTHATGVSSANLMMVLELCLAVQS